MSLSNILFDDLQARYKIVKAYEVNATKMQCIDAPILPDDVVNKAYVDSLPIGNGDVVGPVLSTDNAVPRYSGIDGKTIKNSGVIIDNSNNMTGVNDLTVNNHAICATLPTLDQHLVNKAYIDSQNFSFFTGTSNGIIITATALEASILPLTYLGGLQIFENTYKQGDAYHMILAGLFSSQNGNTLTLRWKLNGITEATQVVSLGTGVVGQHFEIEVDWVIRKIGGAGVADIATNWDFTYSDTTTTQFRGDRNAFINNTTFSTEVSNTLSMTAQFSTNSANNYMMTQMGYITRMNRF